MPFPGTELSDAAFLHLPSYCQEGIRKGLQEVSVLETKPSKGSGIKLTPNDFVSNTQGDFVCLMSDYTAITF